MKPAVFFDRDGVLNIDRGYVASRERFEWTPGAVGAVRALNQRGFLVFVATNQSGIARGLFTEAEMHALHAFMRDELARDGAHIDDFRHCPFLAGGSVAEFARDSDWRKPRPGMLLDLMRVWPVDRGRSVVIGDKESDLEAAANAGLRGLRFSGGDLEAFVRRHVLEPADALR